MKVNLKSIVHVRYRIFFSTEAFFRNFPQLPGKHSIFAIFRHATDTSNGFQFDSRVSIFETRMTYDGRL
jgi:hypothetical protein